MGKTQVQTYEQEHKAWKERNPLRAWRNGPNHVSLMDAAVRIGVSMSMIQLWEKGVHVPRGPQAKKIEELCGRGTMRRWVEWKNEMPTPR